MTKGEINRLGERLKAGTATDEDWRALDALRMSFTDALATVQSLVRGHLGMETGGRIKLATSIVEKLRRRSTKLAGMQDVAGCRIIVEDIAAQDAVVEQLCRIFRSAKVVDRRQRPSHGYRAVHVIVMVDKKLVETQVRTIAQHLWAMFSEQLADKIDPAVKYGGGPPWVRLELAEMSRRVAQIDQREARLADKLKGCLPEAKRADEPQRSIAQERHDLRSLRDDFRRELSDRSVHIMIRQATETVARDPEQRP